MMGVGNPPLHAALPREHRARRSMPRRPRPWRRRGERRRSRRRVESVKARPVRACEKALRWRIGARRHGVALCRVRPAPRGVADVILGCSSSCGEAGCLPRHAEYSELSIAQRYSKRLLGPCRTTTFPCAPVARSQCNRVRALLMSGSLILPQNAHGLRGDPPR
jgi:hypothetical protein